MYDRRERRSLGISGKGNIISSFVVSSLRSSNVVCLRYNFASTPGDAVGDAVKDALTAFLNQTNSLCGYTCTDASSLLDTLQGSATQPQKFDVDRASTILNSRLIGLVKTSHLVIIILHGIDRIPVGEAHSLMNILRNLQSTPGLYANLLLTVNGELGDVSCLAANDILPSP